MKIELKQILTLLSVFFVLNTISGEQLNRKDTVIIELSELSFISSFEKDYFSSSKENDLLGLCAVDEYMEIEKFNIIHDDIRASTEELKLKVSKKKLRKKAQLIYNSIHDQYFQQYITNATFSDIFSKGMYNCVTATALYAYVFKSIGISYQIYSTPTHVFLIVDPDGEKILIESTDPVYGFHPEIQSEMEKVRKELLRYKLIGDDEKVSYSLGGSIEQSATLGDMVAFQYYNEAIRLIGLDSLDIALENSKKAYYLHSDFPAIEELLWVLYFLNFDNEKDDLIRKTEFLFNFLQLSDDYELKKIESEFEHYSHKLIVNSSDTATYNQVYNLFINNLEGECDEISFTYNCTMGEFYLANNQDHLAEKHLIAARIYNKKNIIVQNQLNYILRRKFRNSNNAEIAIEEIMEYTNLFPTLLDDKMIQETLLLGYFIVGANYYIINDLEKGSSYYSKASSLLNDGIRIDSSIIGNACYEAWRSYTRNNYNEMANEWLIIGLNYDHFNEDLNRVNQY